MNFEEIRASLVTDIVPRLDRMTAALDGPSSANTPIGIELARARESIGVAEAMCRRAASRLSFVIAELAGPVNADKVNT